MLPYIDKTHVIYIHFVSIKTWVMVTERDKYQNQLLANNGLVRLIDMFLSI